MTLNLVEDESPIRNMVKTLPLRSDLEHLELE